MLELDFWTVRPGISDCPEVGVHFQKVCCFARCFRFCTSDCPASKPGLSAGIGQVGFQQLFRAVQFLEFELRTVRSYKCGLSAGHFSACVQKLFSELFLAVLNCEQSAIDPGLSEVDFSSAYSASLRFRWCVTFQLRTVRTPRSGQSLSVQSVMILFDLVRSLVRCFSVDLMST